MKIVFNHFAKILIFLIIIKVSFLKTAYLTHFSCSCGTEWKVRNTTRNGRLGEKRFPNIQLVPLSSVLSLLIPYQVGWDPHLGAYYRWLTLPLLLSHCLHHFWLWLMKKLHASKQNLLDEDGLMGLSIGKLEATSGEVRLAIEASSSSMSI